MSLLVSLDFGTFEFLLPILSIESALKNNKLPFSPLQIREDWKYVAMVIDRLQLVLFFIVTTAGTVGILMDAPHIFEYVDQDRIIEIYRGK